MIQSNAILWEKYFIFVKHLLFTNRMTLPHQVTWWCHQMETFSALLAICAGNSPVPGEFPAQRPVTRSFDVFLDLRPNERLSKHSWGWWFETLSSPLWRHSNDHTLFGLRRQKFSSSFSTASMPWSNIDLGQHWLKSWLVASRHQAITWTDFDWSPSHRGEKALNFP